MSFITNYRPGLDNRHYITDATAKTHWYNFYEGKLREFVTLYGYDFCLVINGSTDLDDAYVLPFKDFKGFFSPDFLDANHRWVGNVRDHDEVIELSIGGRKKEMFASEYHNAFHLLQDAPPQPKKSDHSGIA